MSSAARRRSARALGAASMVLIFLGGVFGLGCATAPPPRESSPRVDDTDRSGGVGYGVLPEALAVDPRRVSIPPLDFEVRRPTRLTFENGLRVYLLEDHATPLVTVRALVAAGNVDEPAPKLGAADLLFELMASGGAGKYSADELDELLAFHAADVAGSASEEHSWFGLNFRSGDERTLLPVFAEMLLRPKFQKDRFEIARSRYLEAIRRRPDSPDGLAARALKKAVFGPDALFAREATAATVNAITVADLKALHQKAMSPKNVSLLVSGDFRSEEMISTLKSLFGAWKGPDRVQRSWPKPQPLSRRVIIVPKATAQTKIRIGGYGFERLSPEEYAYRVANTALGSFGVGRMYREVRDAKGLAYSAYAVVNPGPVTGLFFVGADTRPESTAAAIEASLAVLDGVAGKKPLKPEEVSVATDMYLNSFVFRFDSAEKIVREKAIFDLFGYPDDYLETYREHITRVNVESASKAARKLADLQALQIVVVGPPEKMGDLSRFGPVTIIEDVEAFR